MAQAACSREEPQPKFFPATRICPEKLGLFKTKSGLGWLLLSKRQSRNRFSPNPSRVVAFRKRAGIIGSVSIFSIGRGTTDDVNFSNFFIRIYFAIRIEYVYQTINLKSLLPLSVLMSYCWPHAPPNNHNPQWRLISLGQSHILHPPFA